LDQLIFSYNPNLGRSANLILDHCAIQGRAVPNAVKRINVGGKLLTNLLKETVSFTKVQAPRSSTPLL
jgi:hypothetical protein